jgi:hypothetical protein
VFSHQACLKNSGVSQLEPLNALSQLKLQRFPQIKSDAIIGKELLKF